MDTTFSDLRIGLRKFVRTPSFTVVAVATLAVGIGLATAVSTVANAVLLRRLPVADQNRVVVVAGEAKDRGMDNVPLSLSDAGVFSRSSRALAGSALVIYNGAAPVTIEEDGRVSQMERALVSGDYFGVLGARPLLGRILSPDDDAAGATPVLVLSHRAWQTRFGGALDVVGRQVVVHESGTRYTIVGVMPPGLDFPRGTDFWAPVRPSMPAASLSLMGFNVVGRLAAGASIADARSEMTAYYRRDSASAWERGVRGAAHLLPDLIVGNTRPALVAFALAGALLLCITCVNVANLLLVRGAARAREFAVRTALGASRARIISQLLTEHLLLAVAGSVLGVALAAAAVRAFVALAPPDLPRLDEVRVDGHAIVAALMVTTAATLLFALLPALMSAHADPADSLRSGERGGTSRRSRTLVEGLVTAQIALSVLVLAAAGLIGRSLMKLENVDLSLSASKLSVAELSFPADRYAGPEAQGAMLDRLVAAVESFRGVQAASPVVAVPYAGTRSWEGRLAIVGQSDAESTRNPTIDFEVVAPHFFDALGLRVTRGRTFTDGDREGTAPVVVLSESIAERYWPGMDPVGKHVVIGGHTGREIGTVIGIVPDSRYRDLREPRATVYFALRQSFFPFAPTTFLVRSSLEPTALASAMRTAIEQVAPGVDVAKVTSFDRLLARPLAQPRMNALLLGVFATASLLLASIGLFGVLSAMVRQRTRELGIRMALGATSGAVAWLVVRRGLSLSLIGTGAGLIGALFANRTLGALLFQIQPTDAPTLVIVACIVVGVAAVATALPAQSSSAIEPAIALRCE